MKNSRDWTTLQWALVASVMIHGFLLSIRFVDPKKFNRIFKDSHLEVILVNAKTTTLPTLAQTLAQVHMDGGGEKFIGRSSNPLPASLITLAGDASTDSKRQEVKVLLKKQTILLTRVKQRIAELSSDIYTESNQDQSQIQRDQKKITLLKLLGEIEKRINTENARPRKLYISPATKESAYAIYYDQMRTNIEKKGTENFPESDGRKIYGELTMIISVDFEGHLINTELVKSSGDRILDRRAQAIVQSSSPFGKFSSSMRNQAEEILLITRFKFNKNESLETQLMNK